jgi:hypothetical protein
MSRHIHTPRGYHHHLPSSCTLWFKTSHPSPTVPRSPAQGVSTAYLPRFPLPDSSLSQRIRNTPFVCPPTMPPLSNISWTWGGQNGEGVASIRDAVGFKGCSYGRCRSPLLKDALASQAGFLKVVLHPRYVATGVSDHNLRERRV